MTKSPWIIRLVQRMMWLVPGAAIVGTSCGLTDIRDAAVAAGLDFVEDSASEVLNAVFPVGEILSGE